MDILACDIVIHNDLWANGLKDVNRTAISHNTYDHKMIKANQIVCQFGHLKRVETGACGRKKSLAQRPKKKISGSVTNLLTDFVIA